MQVVLDDDLMKQFRETVSRYLYATMGVNAESWEDYESASNERALRDGLSVCMNLLKRETDAEWQKQEKQVFVIDFSSPYIAEEMYNFVNDLDLWSCVRENGCSVAEYVAMYARSDFGKYLIAKGYKAK